ncbi:MAG: MerR family transcriptional regulator, partial [Streptococcaceae bacterium]|nr:MerR family transcriptional regulator [Streptococcaceae bacterium]
MNIKEASDKVGVSADTIRYYEKIGLLSRVDRTAGGIRDFNERTLARINYIKNMRHAGLSIESLK